ncbi:hypothetical protein KR044_009200, partial [Drosophila immigrans]
CGNYCFKAIKPMLDYTRNLHNQINEVQHQSEYLAKLETREKLIDDKFDVLGKEIDQKLENLRTSSKLVFDSRFTKIGSKYYYIEQSPSANWLQAVHKCRTLGAHLVTIENLSEFNAIVSKLQPRKNYWTDISDLATKGEYRSITTGNIAAYFNWHGQNPDNLNNVEHCVDLWFHNNKHLMNDCNCDEKKCMICELDNK